MRNLVLAFLLLLIILSCNKKSEFSTNKTLKDSLFGDWEIITEIDSNHVYPKSIFPTVGYSFSKDSIEFFNGLFKRDTSKGYKSAKYLGNFNEYKIQGNQLFIKNLDNKKWQKFWKIKHIKNDTLFVINSDKSIEKLKKLKYDFKIEKDFDKIVYSSSPCFGRCQIINISLDRNGNIFYQGIAYTDKVGFYSGKLDQNKTNFIFKKFEKANITNIKTNYSASHTDDQTITTSFIKNGKVIKSISDYGREAPNELVWAYIPIGYIASITKLTKITTDEEIPNIQLFSFSSKNKELPLGDSEGFYLWTELKKSLKKEISFSPLYNVLFNYHYYMDKNNNLIKPEANLKAILSDGRYYKFEFIDNHHVTYDLGYNFIENNFKQENFK